MKKPFNLNLSKMYLQLKTEGCCFECTHSCCLKVSWFQLIHPLIKKLSPPIALRKTFSFFYCLSHIIDFFPILQLFLISLNLNYRTLVDKRVRHLVNALRTLAFNVIRTLILVFLILSLI